jgi:hypothetical protein
MKVQVKKNTYANSKEAAVALEVRIRCRAYELYERRGRADGCDLEDWLQAEAELLSERAKPLAGAAAKRIREPPGTSTGKTTAKRVRKPKSPAQTKTPAQ